MNHRLLIAYASKYGSTAEIAEAIASSLQKAGFPCDCREVSNVPNLDPYTALVVGSAVYMGSWRKEAEQFLNTHLEALKKRPVWLFSTGPTGEGDPVELMKGWKFPQKLEAITEALDPRDIRLFHGKLDPKKLGLMEKLAVKAVKAPFGDYRNWSDIREWAGDIARALTEG